MNKEMQVFPETPAFRVSVLEPVCHLVPEASCILLTEATHSAAAMLALV